MNSDNQRKTEPKASVRGKYLTKNSSQYPKTGGSTLKSSSLFPGSQKNLNNENFQNTDDENTNTSKNIIRQSSPTKTNLDSINRICLSSTITKA